MPSDMGPIMRAPTHPSITKYLRLGSKSHCACAARLSACFQETAQDLSHAPRLRDASTRCVRWLGIENLCNRADPKLWKMRHQPLQKLSRARPVVRVQLQPRINPGPDEPGPHCALMIGGVARPEIAAVSRLEVGVTRGQGAGAACTKDLP